MEIQSHHPYFKLNLDLRITMACNMIFPLNIWHHKALAIPRMEVHNIVHGKITVSKNRTIKLQKYTLL